jgi:hypothetical protein
VSQQLTNEHLSQVLPNSETSGPQNWLFQGEIKGNAKLVNEWYQCVVIVRGETLVDVITCPIVVTTLTVVLHQLYLSLIPLFLLSPLVHQHIALVKASTFLKELQVPRISSTACRNYDQNRLLCGSLGS